MDIVSALFALSGLLAIVKGHFRFEVLKVLSDPGIGFGLTVQKLVGEAIMLPHPNLAKAF